MLVRKMNSFDWEILGDQECHYGTIFRPPNSANVVLASFNFDSSLFKKTSLNMCFLSL
jgi:hypothetical protein